MPYNLRKRTKPEVEPEPPIKKRRAPSVKKEVKKPKTESKKPKTEPNGILVEPPKVEPPKQEPSKVDSPEVESSKSQDEVKPIQRVQMAFGNDGCGELGQGKTGITKKSPTVVPIGKPIKQVACGPMHALSLTEDGQVYSYGCNDEGALGRVTDGDEVSEATPTKILLDGTVIKITAGDSHSAALTDQNTVFVWGNFRDEHGSVGLTPKCDGQASYKPIQLLSDKKIKDIASGTNHMLLLDTDGNVYSFGVGAQGQLGRLKPDDIGEKGNSHPITADNRELFLTPQKVSLKDVDPNRPFICDAIYAGNFSSFATNTDKKKNRLAGWGLNNYFQLGYKGQKGHLVQHFPRRSTFTCSTSIIGVACGQHHTLFLTKSSRVYSAGRHDYGMLGLGKVDKEVCPAKSVDALGNSIVNISAGINTSFAVDSDGKLYSWGMGGTNLGHQSEEDFNKPTEVKSFEGKKVMSVSAGGSFTSVVVS